MTLSQNIIGCDIAKHHLDFFDPSEGTVRRIANLPAAVAAYLADSYGPGHMVIYEATGSYDRLLRHALARAGMAAARVNPTMARRFAQACGRRAKTDQLDARMLADLGERLMPELGALSPKKIAALAGLAPYNHDSGMLKGRRCISGGRRRVRQALYMAALSAIRHCRAIGTSTRPSLNALKPKKSPSLRLPENSSSTSML